MKHSKCHLVNLLVLKAKTKRKRIARLRHLPGTIAFISKMMAVMMMMTRKTRKKRKRRLAKRMAMKTRMMSATEWTIHQNMLWTMTKRTKKMKRMRKERRHHYRRHYMST